MVRDRLVEFRYANNVGNPDEQQNTCFVTLGKKEGDMNQALMAVQVLFYLMGGLGLFFCGIGALWFVDVYKKKAA